LTTINTDRHFEAFLSGKLRKTGQTNNQKVFGFEQRAKMGKTNGL
jgi:hypothetical protein